MKKNILIAIAALGGILLVSSIFSQNPVAEVQDVEVEEAQEATLATEVVENFPTYPNVAVSNFRESIGDDGRVFYSFSLVTEDSITDINDWYHSMLSQNGWAVTSDKNVAGYQIIQAEKDNLYTSMQAANGVNSTAIISQQAQIRP